MNILIDRGNESTAKYSVHFLQELDLYCTILDSERVYIFKNRGSAERGEVDYSTFLKVLKIFDETLYMKYYIQKLREISEKYNCTIITAKQQPYVSYTTDTFVKMTAPRFVCIDYVDVITPSKNI